MATNSGRLLLALGLTALAAWPAPAAAEVPRTTLDWFNLIHRRNSDIYGVRMESSWQRLEDGKLVEEWDQIVETDDLGGIRIEELGRTQPGPKGDDTILITDAVYAYNASEYRELTKTWVTSKKQPLTAARKAELRAGPPRTVFGEIEEEPGGPSGLRRTMTPMRMADHWFLECLSNTMPEGLDLQVRPLEDRPGLWEVLVDSDDDTYGHKCRAVVDEGKDLRVVELEMWDAGRWSARYEVEYELRERRWMTASGRYERFARPGSEPSAPATLIASESRFSVTSLRITTVAEDPTALPEFPAGTRTNDTRTRAMYTVGRDREVDGDFERLVEIGEREENAPLANMLLGRIGGPRLWFWANWFFAGIFLAVTVQAARDLRRRLGRTGVERASTWKKVG
jgi:hypothetical protein